MKNLSIELSDTWKSIFGYAPSHAGFDRQLAGETHIHPDDLPLLLDRLELMKQGSNYEMVEIRIATLQGRYLWCRVRGTANRDQDGILSHVVGVIINIDTEKQAQQDLEDRADRDALTQLLNKEAVKRHIEQHLNQSHHSPDGALMVLDLDNFKEVNDRFGHLYGDDLLKRIARILTDLFHTRDLVARIGGDEFLVMVRGVTDRHLLASQCRRLRDQLLLAFRREVEELQLGFSVGIALCPEHGADYFSLFEMADQALYNAKAAGKNGYCFYGGGMGSRYLPAKRAAATPIDSDNPGFPDQDALSREMFRLLSQTQDIPAAIDQIISMIGSYLKVSRAYIFENSDDDTYCSNTFEWCSEGVTPEKQNLQHVSYITDIPGQQENFDERGLFYCSDVRELPPAAYAVLEPQGIRSMLHCAIRQNGRFRGYVGLDDCDSYRMWTKNEVDALSYFSDLLSVFLLNYREREALSCKVDALQTRLDHLSGKTDLSRV